MIASLLHSRPTLTEQENYVWVYPHSNRKFIGIIPEDATLLYEHNKNGKIKSVTFNDQCGNLTHLECITKGTLRSRKPYWVLPGTDQKYKYDIPVEALQLAQKDKNGKPDFVTFKDPNGRNIRLECISGNTLNKRKSLWVLLGTDKEYKSDIPVEAIETAELEINGNPKAVTIRNTNGTKIYLERTIIQTLKSRKLHWIIAGTLTEYQGDIPLEALDAAEKDKYGNPKFVTIKNNSTNIHLECIKAAALKRRLSRNTKPLDFSPAFKCTPKSSLQAPLSPIDVLADYLEHPLDDNVPPSQEPMISEATSHDAQPNDSSCPCFMRDKIEIKWAWVYQDSCILYEGIIPDEQSWEDCLKDDSGKLVSILIQREGWNRIWLERITVDALAERLMLNKSFLFSLNGFDENIASSDYEFQSDFQSDFSSEEPPIKRQRI
jgi:hypothetical protein